MAEGQPIEGAHEIPFANGFSIRYSNGLHIERNDGSVKLQLGGSFQADFASINADSLLNLAVPNGSGEGVEFRRARIYFSGELWKRLIFKAEYDFAGSNLKFADVWLGLKNLGPVGELRFGNMKEPFSLEELTSFKYITFMERSLARVFDSERNVGLMANNVVLDQRMTWAIGIFAPTDNTGSFFDDQAQFHLGGRLTGLPSYNEAGDRYVHLGASVSYQYARDVSASLARQPEAHLAQNYIDTGSFQRNSQTIISLEAAWVRGPLSLQGEYKPVWVERPSLPTANFVGGYVLASYFLTGEHRPYERRIGVFGRVSPKRPFDPAKGHWGAVQLALRYSAVDLNDAGLNGGTEHDITAGINWHLYSNTRLWFNYVWADVVDTGDQNRSGFPDPGLINATGHINIFQMRAQIEY